MDHCIFKAHHFTQLLTDNYLVYSDHAAIIHTRPAIICENFSLADKFSGVTSPQKTYCGGKEQMRADIVRITAA